MFHSSVLSGSTGSDKVFPDELLYGRAGCLYSLLYVKQHTKGKVIENQIASLAKVILDSGKKLAKKLQEEGHQVPPLMYEWHGSKYLAAAH